MVEDLDVECNQDILEPLTFTERYSHQMSLLYIFERIALGDQERTRIINDGISSIEDFMILTVLKAICKT